MIPEAAAETIVFLPGTLCDARLFAAQIARAKAAGRRAECLNYDGFRDLGEWAESALARLPRRFALAGLSLGGIAAMELIRRAPRRVNRLALMDTNPAGETEAGAARRKRDFARAEAVGLERFIAEEMIPRQLHPANLANPELRAVVLRMALDAGMEKWREQLDLASARKDSRRRLEKFCAPTLVCCGGDDSVCPPELHREMAELIPNATLRIFPRCGHLSSLEAADSVSEELMKLLGA